MNLEDLAKKICSSLMRDIIAEQMKFADAVKNLKKYLDGFIRSELLDKVFIDKLLSSIKNQIEGEFDKDKVLEELVDNYMADDKEAERYKGGQAGKYLVPLLEGHMEDDFDFTEKQSEDMLAPGGPSSNDDIKGDPTWRDFDGDISDILKKMVKEYAPLIYQQLRTRLQQLLKEWSREHEEEARITEETPEPGVKPLHEQVEEERKKWDMDLVHDFIDNNAPKKRKDIYHFILEDILINNMTKVNFLKKYDISKMTLDTYIKDLKLMLAKWFSDIGVGPKFIDKMDEKDIKPPDYKTHLKNPDNAKSFKKFLEEEKDITEHQKKMMDLLVEGKSPNEIAKHFNYTEPVKSWGSFWSVKKRFNKYYREWYDDMVKDIKKAFQRIINALLIIEGKRVEVPVEKIPGIKPRPGVPEPISEKDERAVDEITRKNLIEAVIRFSANYDNVDIMKKKGPDPTKDPVDFRYKRYVAIFDGKRHWKKALNRIFYRYAQDLNNDGGFKGTSSSKFEVDGIAGPRSLKEKLDKYVEQKMKPEGILPWGQSVVEKHKTVPFGVSYINVKTKKEYDGVKDFTRKYQGLLVADIPHEERGFIIKEKGKERRIRLDEFQKSVTKEITKLEREYGRPGIDTERKKEIQEELDLLKEFSRGSPEEVKQEDVQKVNDIIEREKERRRSKIREKEKMKKEAVSEERQERVKKLQDLRSLLKNREDMLKALSGTYTKYKPKKTEKLEERKEELKKEISGIKDKIKDLEKLLEETKEPFPSPESAGMKKFIKEVSDLRIEPKKLYEFLTPSDLIYYVNQIQAALGKDAEEDKKGIKKNKNMSEEDKQEEYEKIDRRRRRQLQEFVNLIDDIPSDLKKRLEKYEKADPDGYKNLKEKLKEQINWVNKPDTTISKLKQKLTVPKMITVPKEKQKVIKPIEEKDFKDSMEYLESILTGLGTIARRFDSASLKEQEINPELKSTLEKNLTEFKGKISDAQKKLSEISEEVDVKEIKKLREDLKTYVPQVRSISTYLTEAKRVPALVIAEVLKDKITDFNKLSWIANTLFYGLKEQIKIKSGADDEGFVLDPGDEEDLKTLRTGAVNAIITATRLPLATQAKKIKEYLRKAKEFIDKFIKLYRIEVMRKYAFILPYSIITADKKEKDWKTERIKYIFPAGELEGANSIIRQLAKLKKRKQSEEAQKELSTIIKNITKSYGDMDKDFIDAIARKENISPEKAAVRLKRIKDSLAASALSEFILKWKTFAETGREKKKEPASEKFKDMREFLEEHIPKIFKPDTTKEIPEELPRGIPTPKKIRERIEREFTRVKPQFKKEKGAPEEEKLKEKFDFYEEGGGGKGKGPKTKARPKSIKKHPPSYTYEKLKSNFVKELTTKDAEDIVFGMMARYIVPLKNEIEKGEYYYNPDEVIDALVKFLSGMGGLIRYVTVGLPNSGADIIINNSGDAEKVVKKILDIWDVINDYISPLKAGPPSKDVSQIRTKRQLAKTYFPNWKGAPREEGTQLSILDLHQKLKEEEGKKSSFSLACRIAKKFAGTNISNVDNYTEEDLISIS